jgi:isoleucyl-tRNA synthetase
LYANIDEVDPDDMDIPVEQRPEIDRWVISRLNTMLDQISKDMAGYELSRVTRAIESFLVDEVSNWYVRRSRERFWSNEFDLDKKSAYRTLYEVLIALSKAMAPFAPFLAEDIYLNLTRGKAMESVHLEDYPTADKTLIDPSLEERMGLVITVVSLGRSVRNKMQIKVRQPLRKMMVNGKHQGILKDMEDLVKEELNVKHIEYVGSLTDYVDYEVRANLPVAGPKFGKDLRTIIAALGKLDAQEAVAVLETEGTLALSLDGRELTLSREDIDVRMSAREGFAVEVEDDTFVVLDTEIDQELAFEGHAREIVSKVQTMRKNAGFDVVDHISMVISSDDVILEAVRKHMDYIQTETLCDKLELTNDPVQGEEWDINGHNATIRVEKL